MSARRRLKTGELTEERVKKPPRIKLKPKTNNQQLALEALRTKQVIFLLGAAGSGKTLLSTLFALDEFNQGNYEKMVITRPVMESGEQLGYLPGSMEEKINPYLVPIQEYIKSNSEKDFYNNQVGLKNIKIVPFAYMRGVTWHKSIIIADELQNVTNKQLLMFLTRLGENSKIIITADPSQSDLRIKNDIVGIAQDLAKEDDSVATIVFGEEDIVRNELIKKIVKVFKNYNTK